MTVSSDGLLVLTHGHLAEELVRAVRTIVGEVDRIEPVSIGWDDDPEEARVRIEGAMARLGAGSRVLILTDMFGGTPTNLALSFLEPGRVEVVTGVNLPMLIKFTNLRGELAFDEVVRRIADQGREAIQVASGLLEKAPPPHGDDPR